MKKTKRIMFVCTGNICRSPLAHALLEKQLRTEMHKASNENAGEISFEVESSGTHGYHVGHSADERMRATAARHNAPFDHAARRFTSEDIVNYDYIFAMGRGHIYEIEDLAQLTGTQNILKNKLYLFRQFDPELRTHTDQQKIPDVPDPYYGGSRGFEEVYNIVERTVRELVQLFLAQKL